MGKTKIQMTAEQETENPLFIEGLAGVGHIGRNSVSYIAEKMGARKIGEISSSHFPPYAIVSDEKTVQTIKNEIYELEREDQQDIVFLEGNAQANNPEGHHEVADKVMDLVEQVGATEIVTVGGYGTGDVVEEPDVMGVTTEEELQEKYGEYDITFEHDVEQVVGVSGLLLGLAQERGYEGICILGETPGFLLSDPKSTETVIKVIESIIDADLDFTDLDEKVEESQEILKKIRNLKDKQGQGQDQDGQKGQAPDLGYIG
ncbi:proteasome assembly chaperone family protein [Candidatus Nanohaloarchaea archaeon]|nr:proteasome assembly chaperone family protein [Candidatus Nanohaloarchaea archaeon]